MSILSKLFGGGQSNSDVASPYLDEISNQGHKTYDSYINEGKDASGRTKTAYEEMMDDPTGFINKIMEHYTTSEGYNFQKDRLTKEMGNTAAMGGIAGTPYDQQNQAAGVQGLLSKDMQQFLENALGVHNTGLTGEEGVAERGYKAGQSLNDVLGGVNNSKAGLAVNDEQNATNRRNQIIAMIGKALGAGVGGLVGGVPGATVGAGLFGGK